MCLHGARIWTWQLARLGQMVIEVTLLALAWRLLFSGCPPCLSASTAQSLIKQDRRGWELSAPLNGIHKALRLPSAALMASCESTKRAPFSVSRRDCAMRRRRTHERSLLASLPCRR